MNEKSGQEKMAVVVRLVLWGGGRQKRFYCDFFFPIRIAFYLGTYENTFDGFHA